MKIMEEGVVHDHRDDVVQQGDCDFGTYIQDEDEIVSPDYYTGFYEDNKTLPNNKKDQPRRGSNSVEALVRHFKIFFPKSKKSKHLAQSQPELQHNGLRSFSFSDSKIGKEFEHFTMGHASEFFSFDTEYIDEGTKAETAPPLHYTKRSRIIGDESIFNGLVKPDNQTNSFTDEDELAVPFSQPEEDIIPRTSQFNAQGRNEYLFPDGSNSTGEIGLYQNCSKMGEDKCDDQPIASDFHDTDNVTTNDFNEPNTFETIHDDLYEFNENVNSEMVNGNERETNDYNQEILDRNQENDYNQEILDRSQENDYNQDSIDGSQVNFESEVCEQEDQYTSGSPYESQSDQRKSSRNSDSVHELDNFSMNAKHKSMSSLVEQIPQPPPIDPNRPLFRDEELKVYRSTANRISTASESSLKRGSSNFFGNALKRISSYFSLKKDKSWSTNPDSGVELSKF